MKFLATVSLILAFTVSCFAAEGSRSFTDKVEGGSLVVTNDAEEGVVFELKRVEFRLPTTNANAFAIIQNRKFLLPDTTWTEVETNLFTDVVTTNTRYRTAGTATFAFTNTIANTTNDVTPQHYDEDDFGKGLTFEEEDVQTFSFTCTNALYMIRVYRTFPRP